jgi:2-keto-3-deoxy-6-phosphogluconate aldolase
MRVLELGCTVDPQVAPSYLRLSNVLAIGCSWMAPELVRQNRFTEIRQLAVAAASL